MLLLLQLRAALGWAAPYTVYRPLYGSVTSTCKCSDCDRTSCLSLNLSYAQIYAISETRMTDEQSSSVLTTK